jgi:hypothetical protein
MLIEGCSMLIGDVRFDVATLDVDKTASGRERGGHDHE